MIVASAIRLHGHIITGKRHYHCFDKLQHVENFSRDQLRYVEQGFIDEYGNFYTRDQALTHARQNNQLKSPHSGIILMSEDLW